MTVLQSNSSDFKILSNKRFEVFSCPIPESMSVVKDEFLICDGCLF